MTMTSTGSSSSNRESQAGNLLLEKLAAVLPKGYKFGINHLSTPPTRTDALCAPPPGLSPDKTYCEKHFLAISIDADKTVDASRTSPSKQTLILALEVFIFTTAYSTIIFVSKADSTGYLQLLGLPKQTASPIREATTAFLAFLAEHRRRKGIQTVVSLFARAQSQYLFPGSVENSGKHVLDDRGLVKWWCRVLNPLLEGHDRDDKTQGRREQWGDIKGYLSIPGLDQYETRAFLPRTPASAANWTVGHPLELISHYTAEHDSVPPRCLIPMFPDDPKSRFRAELDDEALKRKQQDTGSWKSVKNLDQFWEMMAFRQECSSGRLTGFIWIVFGAKKAGAGSQGSESAIQPSTPSKVQPNAESAKSTPSKPTDTAERKTQKKNKKLTGRIIPRQPHIKTHQRNHLSDRPVSTAYYYWPPEGRGGRIVDEADYQRSIELLLHLDFSTLAKACASTKRWISEVGIGSTWGRDVVGTRELRPSAAAAAGESSSSTGAATVTNLTGLVKRKRPVETEAAAGDKPVNVLGAGLVRKKQKEGVINHL